MKTLSTFNSLMLESFNVKFLFESIIDNAPHDNLLKVPDAILRQVLVSLLNVLEHYPLPPLPVTLLEVGHPFSLLAGLALDSLLGLLALLFRYCGLFLPAVFPLQAVAL